MSGMCGAVPRAYGAVMFCKMTRKRESDDDRTPCPRPLVLASSSYEETFGAWGACHLIIRRVRKRIICSRSYITLKCDWGIRKMPAKSCMVRGDRQTASVDHYSFLPLSSSTSLPYTDLQVKSRDAIIENAWVNELDIW